MCLLSHLSGEQSVQNTSPPNNCALLMKRPSHLLAHTHTHIQYIDTALLHCLAEILLNRKLNSGVLRHKTVILHVAPTTLADSAAAWVNLTSLCSCHVNNAWCLRVQTTTVFQSQHHGKVSSAVELMDRVRFCVSRLGGKHSSADSGQSQSSTHTLFLTFSHTRDPPPPWWWIWRSYSFLFFMI